MTAVRALRAVANVLETLALTPLDVTVIPGSTTGRDVWVNLDTDGACTLATHLDAAKVPAPPFYHAEVVWFDAHLDGFTVRIVGVAQQAAA